MATAYAALVSLMHIMEQIWQYHARHQIFHDEQQTQLQSLKESVSFFQDFLEGYSSGNRKEKKVLESQIADAAHAAEDIIETHIVDDIHGKKSSNPFSQGLKKVMEEMDLIKKEVLEMKEKCRLIDPQSRDLAPLLSSSHPSWEDTTVVFDEDLNYIMDKLSGQQSNRQVIPITGMGGIGKTTLTKYVYHSLTIVEYFDIRGWVTISQQYDEQKILSRLLKELGACNGLSESLEIQNLRLKLHQHLSGRRYLIVFDDMWNIETWDKFKFFLPDKDNGSRILVTTRMSNVAYSLDSLNLFRMSLLNKNKSWDLLCKKVFVKEICPPDLVEIGKTIATNCKGLPLSIGVIGGLLAKSKMVQEYWEYIARNTSNIISSNDEEYCLEILSLSYRHLPIHLIPCFLYLGVFREDYEIRVSKLIKLWVAEGFLKPSKAKHLEEVAQDNLKDLVDRNLVFVSKLGSVGNMKSCYIHDLLRDMCLREAQKERFLCMGLVHMPYTLQAIGSDFEIARAVVEPNSLDVLEGTNTMRRVAVHLNSYGRHTPQFFHALDSSFFLRSLICEFELYLHSLVQYRLIRVLDVFGGNYSEGLFELINSRFLNFRLINGEVIPSSIHKLWNLQTLIVATSTSGVVAPPEIWNMPQLRHVIIECLSLPDPPGSQIHEQGDLVLENLQTLSYVVDFRCTEYVLGKIPNVVILKLAYSANYDEDPSGYCLDNVGRLEKLQSLYCEFTHSGHWMEPARNHLQQIRGFPVSLRKLTLRIVGFSWEEITTKVGSLPRLEKLKLEFCSSGDEWNSVEGYFLNLVLNSIKGLVHWTAENAHFPRLEHLVLRFIVNLKEIPSGIGDIATLESIELSNCSDSVNDLAKIILEEQQSRASRMRDFVFWWMENLQKWTNWDKAF